MPVAHPRCANTRYPVLCILPLKTFTADQANRTLPLVGRIVDDIVRAHARWHELIGACEVAAASSTPGSREEAETLQRVTQQVAEQIDGYISELNALGIEFKGVDPPLVDFPGEIDGRPVYLCWRLGERAVEYWHEIDAGFAGRQPLFPSAVA